MLTKVLIIFLLAFTFFSPPVLAKDKSTQNDPFGNMTLKRGNLHVHTKISRGDSLISVEHPGALELMDTFDIAEKIKLDVVGITDHSHRFNNTYENKNENGLTEDLWLVTRGACSLYSINKELGNSEKQLTALPGFEWTGELHINVFGTDQLVWTNEACIKKNLMKCGKLNLRPDSVDSFTYEDPLYAEINAFTNPARLFPKYFFNKYHNLKDMDLHNIWSSKAESLYWRIDEQPESVSKRIGSVAEKAAEILQAEGLEEMQKRISDIDDKWNKGDHDNTRLLKEAANSLKEEIVDAYTIKPIGDQAGDTAVTEANGLLIPPAIPEDTPLLKQDVIKDCNNRVKCMYAAYYAQIWCGLKLFDDNAVKSLDSCLSSDDFIKITDDALRDWWKNKRMVKTENEITKKGGKDNQSFYQWLASCKDPEGIIVAQINHISDGGPIPDDIKSIVKKMDKLSDFNKYEYSEASDIRDRVCLIEMICGDNDPLHKMEGGPRKIFLLQHFYNFFLANYLKLAPSTGIDNFYRLDNELINFEECLPRQYSTGIWLKESNSEELGGRIKDVLKALRQRRTFVSENPYLKMKFYATIKNADGTMGDDNVLMGEDIFRKSEDLKSCDVRFHLVLEKEQDRIKDYFNISNFDIKLIAVKRPSEKWRSDFIKNSDSLYDKFSIGATDEEISAIVFSGNTLIPVALSKKILKMMRKYFLTYSQAGREGIAMFLTAGTTETENFANHFSRKCYRKAISDCYKTIMEAEPAQKSLSKNGKNSQKGNKSLCTSNDIRDFNERGILHMEYDKSKVLPHHLGGAICYYALIKFPNGEYGITAPIWTCPKIPESQNGGSGSW